MLESRK